jgi:hypothetical protein
MNRKCLLFILFLTLFSFIRAASSYNDIESPLIPVDDSNHHSHSQQYRQLPNNTDNDSDRDDIDIIANIDSNQSWTIPRAQFDVGLPIYGTIFGFLTAWELNDPISLFIRAIYIMSFLVCVQVYFGFYLTCQRRENSFCSFIPEIVFSKIDFGRGPMDVSFGRWISGPFSWISEILSFLPDDAYAYLEEHAYFPPRSITHMIFMVQLLYYFGMYNCYRSNIMTQQS